MHKTKKLRKCIKWAKQGDPGAQYRLGIRFQLGKDCPKDLNQAAIWIRMAAEAGYPLAVVWMQDYGFDDSALLQALT